MGIILVAALCGNFARAQATGEFNRPADRPAPRTDRNSQIAHEQLLKKARKGGIDVYFLGDSITRRWGATDYPEFLANWKTNFFGWNAANFGWGGDRIENMLWRLENGELDGVNPKIIVVLAGINNVGTVPGGDAKVESITRGLKALVSICQQKAPSAVIILTALFPRNDNMAVIPTINRINDNLSAMADGKKIRFLNVNDKLADKEGRLFEGISQDKLHPGLKGYQVWADGLKPIFIEILGPPAKTDHAPPPTGDPSVEPRPAEPRKRAMNPIIHADVPDIAMIRVGDTYYMGSTTMHLSPGLPIMKSKDLVNWEMAGYAYDILDDVDELNLNNGKSAYGRGSWASSIRFHKGTYYVTTFAQTTGKTYIYTTKDIEKGPWKVNTFKPAFHDHSLFFDDDGRVYMLYGGGNLRLVELNEDLAGVKPGGFNQVVITNASAVAGPNIGLNAEGSQLLKHNGKYYVFNIVWPRGGMRTVLVHRADRITGPYEGRVALQDKGVAQGSLIDTPNGEWFAYLFRDFGAVGRIPYLVPVKWENDWPVFGVDGKVPDTLNLPASKGLIPGIVASDEFDRKAGDPALPLVWQWNHNPDNALWSLTARPGFLRLTTGRTDLQFLAARNTLTQRTIGPECSGSTALDVSNLKDGDFAGLALLQRQYGLVGVKSEGGTNFVVMVSAQSGSPIEVQRVPLDQKTVFLKADCDFKNGADKARFFYSVDSKSWTAIGSELKMSYTIPHFMGYRFGLFNYATKAAGGFVDFDYFRVSDKMVRAN